MDEFTPGNTDTERRGRVAYERYCSTFPSGSMRWGDLTPSDRVDWCHVAEAAFEEGRRFEVEHYERADSDECANFLRARGYRVYDPGTFEVGPILGVQGDKDASDPRYQAGSDW